jgi:hypothetical protein
MLLTMRNPIEGALTSYQLATLRNIIAVNQMQLPCTRHPTNILSFVLTVLKHCKQLQYSVAFVIAAYRLSIIKNVLIVQRWLGSLQADAVFASRIYPNRPNHREHLGVLLLEHQCLEYPLTRCTAMKLQCLCRSLNRKI